LYDPIGKIIGNIAVLVDITERKQAEQERLANLHFFESMDRINQAMIGTKDLKQMMSNVLDIVLSIFECDRAWFVYPCDPKAATWRAPMERTRPEYPGAFILNLEIPVDSEVVHVYKAVLASDNPIGFGPGNEHPLPAAVAEKFNEQSQLAMVIYPKLDKPYMFGIHQCSRPRAWTPEERRLLKEIGRRLTDGLSSLLIYNELQENEQKLREHEEQLKSLTSELSLAEERERRRIAAGIHDDIAQRLALAKLELQFIQNTISDSNVISSLKNQCGTIDRIMEDVRSLTFELSNPLLYEIGLEAAIESFLTEQIKEKFGIKCKFISQGPQIDLDEDIRIVLYQGVRELLTNIVKHADASRIEVRIVKRNTQISIIVEDDGIGLNLSKLTPERNKGGFGIFNIRERLEYLGGNLNIQSKPNKGTCVTMSIPLKLKSTAQ
jgi:signal transduction histidine kinase